jgi:hypothetical protein
MYINPYVSTEAGSQSEERYRSDVPQVLAFHITRCLPTLQSSPEGSRAQLVASIKYSYIDVPHGYADQTGILITLLRP